MIEELKNIWKACFDDDDAYIDFYFSHRYKPENTFVHREAGKAVAMLTLLPVSVVTPHSVLPSHYIYAVATLPEYRGKGISSALAKEADKYMRAAEDALAIVVPATESLFDFYAQQEFSTAFFRRVVSFRMDDITIAGSGKGFLLDDIEKFYTLREHYFNTGGFFVRWNKEALQYAANECRASGGDIFYFSDDSNEGYVIVEPVEGIILVKEMALSPDLAPVALSFLKEKYPSYSQIQCRLSMNSPLWKGAGTVEPVAMLKWFMASPPERVSENAYIGLLKD